MRPGCPFCEIASQARVIRRTELSVVFLSNPRLMKGHTLVIPRRHIENPADLTDAERLDILAQTDLVRTALLTTELAAGVDIRQNYRPFLPQGRIKVDHIHYHVLPRRLDDELYQQAMQYETPLFSDLPQAERDEMVRRLQ